MIITKETDYALRILRVLLDGRSIRWPRCRKRS